MFSHVLVAYQAALLDYATKTSSTYQAALKILSEKTHYNFTVLKDLTQVPVVRDGDAAEKKDMTPLDFDQMLFFKVNSLGIISVSLPQYKYLINSHSTFHRRNTKTIMPKIKINRCRTRTSTRRCQEKNC